MLIIIKKGKLNSGKFRAWISVVKEPKDHYWLSGHYEEVIYIKILKKSIFTLSDDEYEIMQTDDFDNEEDMNKQIEDIVGDAIENLKELKKTEDWEDYIYDTQFIKV